MRTSVFLQTPPFIIIRGIFADFLLTLLQKNKSQTTSHTPTGSLFHDVELSEFEHEFELVTTTTLSIAVFLGPRIIILFVFNTADMLEGYCRIA